MGRLLIGIACLAALLAAAPAHAAQINVDTTADEVNPNGNCSLKEAITAAANDGASDDCEPGSGPDVINLPAGNYSLTTTAQGLSVSDSEVTIDGAGEGLTFIDGDNVVPNQVILAGGSDPQRIQDLTVRNGLGRGIQNGGELTLDHVTVTSNGNNGINNQNTGDLTILDSSIDANTNWGVSNGGTLVITDSSVSDNGDLGIQHTGINQAPKDATITGSTISGNDGAGILNFSTLMISDTVISNNNIGAGGFGGGISITTDDAPSTATTTLDEVTVTGNDATGGAGIFNNAGNDPDAVSNLTITDSTIAGNDADSGGGIANVADSGTTTIERSTISGNSATNGPGGGISNGSGAPTASMTLTNSTVSGNDSTGAGGGIASAATTSLSSTTVADNTTSGGGAGGVDIDGGGGGIPVALHGTILADNTGTQGDCFGVVASQGFNLIETNNCTINGDMTGNVLGQDPLLGALADNDGPTFTHELTIGSAALNSGGPACPATDQRGTLRPQGLGCDMGAFEREAPPETTVIAGPADGSTISTSQTSFGFSSSEPGSTFECSVDGSAFAPCASPVIIGPFFDGLHVFQVRARDQENVLDPTPESRTFTVAVPAATPLAPVTLPSSLFSFTVSGNSLQVGVSSPGTINVVDARAPLSASIAKKKKKKTLLLNPSSASGGPPTIFVPLRLTKLAKAKRRKNGKVTVSARITFTPQGGTASTQTAGLRIAAKTKRKKK